MKDGQKGVIDELKKMPEAGVIRTPGSAGYSFRYARLIASTTGDEQLLVVDRPPDRIRGVPPGLADRGLPVHDRPDDRQRQG